MSYLARVYKVFIASPGDEKKDRRVVRKAIAKWNSLHSDQNKVVLFPVDVETDGAPEIGRPAQAYINADILDQCDVLIVLFATTLGTPTDRFASGTVEEVIRTARKNKLTMIYFSQKPVNLVQVDYNEYMRLQKFKEEMKAKGFYADFEDEQDLEQKIYNHIQIKFKEGKFRPTWDSDKLAQIEDDDELAKAIGKFFPNVAENLLKKIIYENHDEGVWCAILEKLQKAPSRLSASLIFLANAGACGNYVFREGSKVLAEISQPDFCTFMNDLYSINRYEFMRLFQSGLMTNEKYKNYLQAIMKRDSEI